MRPDRNRDKAVDMRRSGKDADRSSQNRSPLYLRTISRSERKRLHQLIEQDRRQEQERRWARAQNTWRRTSSSAQAYMSLSKLKAGDVPMDDLSRLETARNLLGTTRLPSMRDLLPLLFNLNGKPLTLEKHFPFAAFYDTHLCRESIWKCARQTGKTVRIAGPQKVLLENGRRIAGHELQIGDRVLSLDDRYRVVGGEVLDVIRQPAKPVLRIKTRMGVTMEIAETHPLLRIDGWTPGAELRVGDRICAIRKGGIFRNRCIPRSRIALTAYYLGDGHGHGVNLGVRTACQRVVLELVDFGLESGSRPYVQALRGRRCSRVSFSTVNSTLYEWLLEDDLFARYSHEKFVPEWVFDLSRRDTALFVSRLWATDGMIKANRRGHIEISYTSTSRELAFDVKSLLLKFGIHTSITKRKTGYRDRTGQIKRCRPAYVVRVETREGLRRFQKYFDVPGKPAVPLPTSPTNHNRDTVPREVASLIREVAAPIKWKHGTSLRSAGLRVKPTYAPSRCKITKYVNHLRRHCADHPKLAELERLTSSDVVWDKIVSIEPIGSEPCWDIEVAGTHNYLLDGIASHNSSSQAAQGVLLSALLPYFNTLFVTPLFEMIRRFSSNYVAPLISQSPVRAYFQDATCTNNVLQRTFRNQSMMIFSFAFTDVDRTRGVNAGKLAVDESVCGTTTYVYTPSGRILVKDIQPGDRVLSLCLESGKIIWREVTASWWHGRRHTYTLETEDGHEITATAETRVATDAGWLRISQIIEIAAERAKRANHAVPDCDPERTDDSATPPGCRDAIGRWAHLSARAVQGESRLVPGRIPVDETCRFVGVRAWDTYHQQEEQARVSVGRLLHCRDAGISLITSPVVPGWSEDDHAGSFELAQQDCIPPLDGLVAGRRRDPVRPGPFTYADDLHERIQLQRGRTLVQLADGTRVPMLDLFDGPAQDGLPDLSDDPVFDADCSSAYAIGSRICHAVHALQDAYQWEERRSGLLLLRDDVHVFEPVGQPESTTPAVLWQPGMPEDQETYRVHRDAARPGPTSEVPSQPVAFQEFGGGEEVPSRIWQRVEEPESGKRESYQGATQAEETSHESAGLQALRPQRASRQSTGLELLSGLPSGTNADSCQDPPLVETSGERAGHQGRTETLEADHLGVGEAARYSRLIRIRYAGIRDVHDIEVDGCPIFVGNGVVLTQCQDLDPAFVPILKETMSASPWGLTQRTGTPKTLENLVEQAWLDSSQGEWVIPCPHCKHVNVPSLEHDLERMLGPTVLPPSREISLRHPAVVCAKCSKPVDPVNGWWYHMQPQLRYDYDGRHIPQIIMPMHYADPEKWAILQGKRMGFGRTPINVFYNEVCAESYDRGAKLLTVTDLKQAATLHENTLEEALKAAGHYAQRVVAVDWGGGGLDEISFTVAAVLGLLPDGRVDVIYGWRSLTPNDPVREAILVLELMKKFRATHLVHDFGGAGALRETIIVQSGLPANRSTPIAYQRVTVGPMMQFKPFNEHTGKLAHHQLDKTRSLQYTCELIKHQFIRFFKYDFKGSDNPGLLHDFLSLVEDRVDSRMGQDLATIIRNKQAGPDDFAHAVNMGACSMFHAHGKWPDVAQLAGTKLDPQILEVMSPYLRDNNLTSWD